MGCLNSTGAFPHWFANIHLSGPCNRACYFCIGQHMMALDALNTLDVWPLPGWGKFVAECRRRPIEAVYVTGTNTDPLLFQRTAQFISAARESLPGVPLGIRTNGIAAKSHPDRWFAYDKGSITICSTDDSINRAMMGGPPCDLSLLDDARDIKINIVLGIENRSDITRTLAAIQAHGPRRVNLREPYGQPHVGNPFHRMTGNLIRHDKGMPVYAWGDLEVTYWDVHYVEVESVNLYANGRVSLDYPITRGHADSGIVVPQSNWTHGRHVEQWQHEVTP